MLMFKYMWGSFVPHHMYRCVHVYMKLELMWVLVVWLVLLTKSGYFLNSEFTDSVSLDRPLFPGSLYLSIQISGTTDITFSKSSRHVNVVHSSTEAPHYPQ